MFRAASIPVLMYHHVSPNPGSITVSLDNFESQLKWLQRRGYRSITTEQFSDFLAGKPLPRKSVLITFDDGYLDNWVYAYPILQKYSFCAVVFLVTSWVHEGPARPYLGQYGNFPDPPPNHQESEALIQAGQSDKVILRWSEIKTMAADGTFEFHSHTDTHTRWDLGEEKANKNLYMAQELARSRQALANHLGQTSTHLCWPQGYFDDDYVELAKQAGFRYLYTTLAFGQNTRKTRPDRIHRFAVRDTEGASAGRRIWLARNTVIGPIFNAWKRWKRSLRERT